MENMVSGNQISAFEYVSILVSIILGLGITQILSSFSDLLFNFKKVKFYWPHTLWILFILFLHIQDWFITYELRTKSSWNLPELMFILMYPVSLFIVAKMLFPPGVNEEEIKLKEHYYIQYPVIFFIMSFSVLFSILFNIFLLKHEITDQLILFCFYLSLLFLSYRKTEKELIHQSIATVVTLASLCSVILEHDIWVIK